MSDALALRATGLLLGIWGLLSAAQWLVQVRLWRDGSALGWDLQRLCRGRFYRSEVIAALYRPGGLALLAGVLASAAIALIALPPSGLTIAALGGFAAAALLLSWRGGSDGADKMILVVASGALLQTIGLWCGSPQLVLAGDLWTGGQLTIAYFASGASKLRLAPWRRGEALSAALSSYMWGHRWTVAAVRQRPAAVLLAWTIMLIEVAFPLALLLPTVWLCAVLAGFFLFHLAIAVTMGLNHYPWAFLAAYPSALLIGQWLRAVLGLG